MSGRVAALFVQKDGCYSGMDNVDPWCVDRDAMLYFGDLPVVAHPPCQLWGSLAFVNYKRWGGEHNRPGNDGGCFEFALQSVVRCGGVLEHPAFTRAWEKYGLTRPSGTGWSENEQGGYVCEVWQSAYGHKARKRTWLYYYSPLGNEPFALKEDREPGTHQVGCCDSRGKSRNKPTLSKKEANATPKSFRDELIALAVLSTKERTN